MNKQLLNKKVLGISALSLLAMGLNAQIAFTNSNTSLHSETGVAGSNTSVRSGNAVAIADVNFDGLDDLVKLDDNRYVRIEYQQVGGTFTYQYIGDFGASQDGWSMALADVDHNGYMDVLYGGWGNGARVMKLNNTGTGVLGSITVLPGIGSSIASQNVNYMDVNNDGWEDIFVCNDVNESGMWVNDGTGNFPSQQVNGTYINFNVTAGTSAPNDESGNYGSVWTDFDNDGDVDLYIAHCRQGQPSGDLRRTNVLFENNGSNSYTSNAAAHNLASNDQDWTASFGDIDNDGDFDVFMTKHDVTSRYYINNGSANFTVSPNTIAFGNMPMQSQFEDLDNDGFVDLIITGDNDHRIYRNNGNGTFTDATPSNLTVSANTALSFASGDLNHDGKIDLYFSYGSTYNNTGSIDDIYWKNTTSNGNHFLTLNLTASASNKTCLGARAFIYGAWGVQTREVRAGESYGTQNSLALHFGLGASTTVDSVVVNWPSGTHSVIVNPSVDQFLPVDEANNCALTNVAITPSGSTNLCSGGNVTLNAPTGTGYTYLWSTGATTQSINVTAAGSYAVQVSEPAGCTVTSANVAVTMNADETPTVSASSSVLTFCQGNSVTLTSTPAASYNWSNGATTQSIVVTTSGTYSVTIAGACQNWTSTATSVTVMPAPSAPTGTDVYISSVQVVTVTATGSNNTWYDAPTGGTNLGTGNSYVTTAAVGDTTFYVEDANLYPGAQGNVGKTNHTGTSNYSGSNNTNAYEIFNVLAPCTLRTVKVYTDTPGDRTIELRDNLGTVLTSTTVTIPMDTSLVTLDFPLSVGTAYRLGTNGAANTTNFGFTGPRLKRASSGVSYPYTLNGLVSITGSDQGSTLYYYFFDWTVEEPSESCASTPRTPVNVFLTTGANTVATSSDFSVYPNPSSSLVSVRMNANFAGQTNVELRDLSGRLVSNYTTENAVKNQLFSFDVSNMAKGVYFVTVMNKGQKITQKLIVQ